MAAELGAAGGSGLLSVAFQPGCLTLTTKGRTPRATPCNHLTPAPVFFVQDFLKSPQKPIFCAKPFEALTRLHAKGCQVSGEVLALLYAGYADGAHARWRSLHEMAVVASLIEKHGQELAERYLLHETIQQYKLACEYQKYFDRLENEPPSKENSDQLRVQRDALIARFGEAFNGDYGWASSAIGKNRPTMSDIEQHVQLNHMRPYYRMASDNVHPNSHGAYFRLGLHSSQQEEVLLAGPSNLGLADPGHSTAISLLQLTSILLATESVLDCVVTMKILAELTDEVGEAFLKVHQELEPLVTDEA